MGWASRLTRKEKRVELVGKKEDETPQGPTLVLTVQPNGDLNIVGPRDIRVCLRMLNEAHDMLLAKMTANFVAASAASERRVVPVEGPAALRLAEEAHSRG
jgi:hypothetical protein